MTKIFSINSALCAHCGVCESALPEFIDEEGNLLKQPQTKEEKDAFLAIFELCPSEAFEFRE